MTFSKQIQNEIIVGKMYDVEADFGEAINTLHQLQLDIGNNFYPDTCEVFSKDTYNTLIALIDDLTKVERSIKTITQNAEAQLNK